MPNICWFQRFEKQDVFLFLDLTLKQSESVVLTVSVNRGKSQTKETDG